MAQAERILRPSLLTAAAFAPYGDVIDSLSSRAVIEINRGYATRFHDLARVEVGDDGRAGVSLFRAKPLPQPIRIETMERHPVGSQAFVPLGGQGFVVVVAPRGDFNSDRIKAFLATDGQGVNYAPGVWHHFLIAQQPQDFLVIDRIGPGENCDEISLTPAEEWILEL